MPFDSTKRGAIERFIDLTIKEIPSKVKLLRNDPVKRLFQIKDEGEYIYGLAYGQVTASFEQVYASNRSVPSIEERAELNEVFFRRIPEIKEAIFRAG